MRDDAETIANFGCVFFAALVIAGWVTHIIICFQEERWLFLIVGALVYPIAVVHGLGHLFELW